MKKRAIPPGIRHTTQTQIIIPINESETNNKTHAPHIWRLRFHSIVCKNPQAKCALEWGKLKGSHTPEDTILALKSVLTNGISFYNAIFLPKMTAARERWCNTLLFFFFFFFLLFRNLSWEAMRLARESVRNNQINWNYEKKRKIYFIPTYHKFRRNLTFDIFLWWQVCGRGVLFDFYFHNNFVCMGPLSNHVLNLILSYVGHVLSIFFSRTLWFL